MKEKCLELAEILLLELQVYGRLAELSDEETRHIVQSDLERLDEIVREIEIVMDTRAELDRRLAVATEELSIELGQNVDGTNLALVAEMAGDPLKSTFQNYCAEIRGLVQRLRRANKNNTELLKASLSFTDSFFRELTRIGSTENSYTGKGLAGGQQHWNLLDTQV